MTRFALTRTTPLLLGMLALAGCPDDTTPIDTEGTSTTEDGDTTMTPTTLPPMTTTINPDDTGTSEESTGSTSTGADPCEGVECPEGEECIGGNCFTCGMPACEPACAEGETCQCPEDDPCCDMGTCGAPVCPLPPVPGNMADCIDDMNVTSDEPCDGAACVADDDPATAAVCLPTGCEAACQCPAAPATGDAVVTCDDVTQDMVQDCYLDCQGGATCPDGMICFGGFICLFSNTAPVDVPLYGDCYNPPAATCIDGFCVTAPTGGVCTAPCDDVADCQPPPATGDAPIQCSDVTNDMMDECWLSCQMDEACPDGMECFGGFVCVWPEIVPPGDGYGDCINNPGSCQPGEDTCLDDGAMPPGAGACSQSGCADAGDCLAAPATGDAVVACEDLGDGNTCYLDCSMGETCPDGMVCTDVGMGMTTGQACLWPGAMVLLEEDFEAGALPAGWSVIDVDGRTPAGAVSFVTDAFVVTDEFEPGMNFGAYSTSWYAPVGAADDWLVTPQITLGTGTSVSWDGWAPDPAYPDGYELRISTGMPTVVDFMANAALLTVPAEADPYAPHTVDLAAAGYMSQDVYLAWHNNSNDQFILVIDNVVVSNVP